MLKEEKEGKLDWKRAKGFHRYEVLERGDQEVEGQTLEWGRERVRAGGRGDGTRSV